MTGEYRHMVDSKGRVFIPSKIREEIGDIFYLTISNEKCLRIYSDKDWYIFSVKADSLPLDKQSLFRPFFSHATKCELDAQGRILIPNNLRRWADLNKEVTVVGNNRHAEIWNSALWDKVNMSKGNGAQFDEILEDCSF